MFNEINKNKLKQIINEIRDIQTKFYNIYGVDDIISNSKIFEVLIANTLKHKLIPGHSGSRDATDGKGEYEYKHFKETSSNHSWTFNDYTDNTIKKLNSTKAVIFAHINDTKTPIVFDWYYKVPGPAISEYLLKKTKPIKNKRKMINVSPNQIERDIKIHKINVSNSNIVGDYNKWLKMMFDKISMMESIVNTTGLLTSNKFWEVLVASELNHNVLSEQGGRAGAHDAIDNKGNCYEYKVSKTYSWNFQDISKEVLNKYLYDKEIILAIVDKNNFCIRHIFKAKPKDTVNILKRKLRDKIRKYKLKGRKIRRRQVSLSKKDLKGIKTVQVL